jgi:hypothetical protein
MIEGNENNFEEIIWLCKNPDEEEAYLTHITGKEKLQGCFNGRASNNSNGSRAGVN